MFAFGEKHPVAFEFILIIAAFIAAAVFTIAGSIVGLEPDLSSSIGRIIVGAALLLIYRRAFTGGRSSGGAVYALPLLLFPAWNIYYNLSAGMSLGNSGHLAEAVLTALAPALFEEVIFRGIFIYNLEKKGCGRRSCILISALVFALVHLTNIVGQDLTSVALQAAYSLAIGMAFAAVYLRSRSILLVVAVHFLIDYSSRIFVEQASAASYLQLALFGLLLAAEAAYALFFPLRA